MTVDVEDYFHVSAFAGAISRDQWQGMERRYEANTSHVLDILAAASTRATFFVLGWVAERSPALVRRIAEAGHEVGCHGYSHQLIYRQSPDKFEEETRQSKRILEDAIGAPVRGYRAASYSIVRESLWALDVLLDAGFEYDSSIFPIRHDRYGIPEAPLAPGRLAAPSGRQLVEFPLSVAQWAGMRVPVAGGGYFRLLPYAATRAGLRQLERKGQASVFYLHPWELDPGQPRIKAGWLSRFRHYNNLHKFEPRLTRLLEEFRFSTMREALAEIGLIDAHSVPTGQPWPAAGLA
jgi:polysaccharide deacetylase family protein (PEP-CTERM system associated)